MTNQERDADAKRLRGLMLELHGFERELLEAEEDGTPFVADAARREMRHLYRLIRRHCSETSLVLPSGVPGEEAST